MSRITRPIEVQPNPRVPPIVGSRTTFFLRSTPLIFTALSPGQSNQDMLIAAVDLRSSSPLKGLPFGERARIVKGTGNQNPSNPGGVGNIASAEAFGSPLVRLLRFVVRVEGISSAEDFGDLFIAGILPPAQPAGEPAELGIRDEELATIWIRDEILGSAATDTAEEPVYRVSVTND